MPALRNLDLQIAAASRHTARICRGRSSEQSRVRIKLPSITSPFLRRRSNRPERVSGSAMKPLAYYRRRCSSSTFNVECIVRHMYGHVCGHFFCNFFGHAKNKTSTAFPRENRHFFAFRGSLVKVVRFRSSNSRLSRRWHLIWLL